MPRGSKYWILAYRDLASPWGVAAGGYSRDEMLWERQHWRDQGTEASRLAILGLADADQLTVDHAIAEMNQTHFPTVRRTR